MDPIEQNFQWAVQALAQPSDVQRSLFPSFVVVADELALDFDNSRRAFQSHFGKVCSTQQVQAIALLDHQLTEMSGADKPELWLNEECLNHPKWLQVRQLAADVLSLFGWSLDRPPLRRSTYAQYSPETEAIEEG